MRRRAVSTLAALALSVVAGCGDDDEAEVAPVADGPACPKGEPDGLDTGLLVGEELADARELARAEGCDVRVVVRDGKNLVVTDDFRIDRVNVAVDDGRVTGIDGVF
jgi:hypothetical protein